MDKQGVASELVKVAKLLTAQNPEREQLAEDIKRTILSVFPRSYADSSYSERLGESIHVRFTLGAKGEWANGIIQNDDVFTIFTIWFDKNDGSMEIYPINGVSILVKPEPGSHMAFSRIKVPFRKTKVKAGDYKKVLALFKTGFEKIKAALKANKENIAHPEYAEGKF